MSKVAGKLREMIRAILSWRPAWPVWHRGAKAQKEKI
jgi:hypothetical protein